MLVLQVINIRAALLIICYNTTINNTALQENYNSPATIVCIYATLTYPVVHIESLLHVSFTTSNEFLGVNE